MEGREESREGKLGGEDYFVSLVLGRFWGRGKREEGGCGWRKQTIMISSKLDWEIKKGEINRFLLWL